MSWCVRCSSNLRHAQQNSIFAAVKAVQIGVLIIPAAHRMHQQGDSTRILPCASHCSEAAVLFIESSVWLSPYNESYLGMHRLLVPFESEHLVPIVCAPVMLSVRM